MSDASDNQKRSEHDVNLSEGTSPSGYDEGSRSTPSNLPKAATRTRKKRTSDSEDEDFVASEATSKKKKVVLAKEYGTTTSSRPSGSAKERTAVRKVPLSKADEATTPRECMPFTLEEPSDAEADASKKKRPRKTTAHVIGNPSMREDDDE